MLPTVCGKEEWNTYGRNKLNAFLGGSEEMIFPNPQTPDVSVILLFHNNAHLSLLCLNAVLQNAGQNYNLILIDNNSTDETNQLLRRCKGAEITRNAENRGFGEACMQGAAQATGKYLLFLNNDTLLEPGAIEAALRHFDNNTVGAIGGKILLATGELQEAGCSVYSDGLTHQYGREDQPDRAVYEFSRPVDYCSGSFLMTPRTLFFELGGFDPIYGLGYYEDVDYCMKVWNAGLQVVYEPACVIRHFESATSGGGENYATYQLFAANRKTVRHPMEIETFAPRTHARGVCCS